MFDFILKPFAAFLDSQKANHSWLAVALVAVFTALRYLLVNQGLIGYSIPTGIGEVLLTITATFLGAHTPALGGDTQFDTSVLPQWTGWLAKPLNDLFFMFKQKSVSAYLAIAACLSVGYAALMYAATSGWHINTVLIAAITWLGTLFVGAHTPTGK